MLSSSSLPSPLPEELRISCIYLQISSSPDGREDLYLTIRDSNGALVDRSLNPIPSFTVPGQSTTTFFFPALPLLYTDRTYTYAFETAAQQPVSVQMACLKGDPARTEEAFPKIRIIAAPAIQDESLREDPAYRELMRQVSSPASSRSRTAKRLKVTADNMAAVEQLSREGYPVAQYALAKALMAPDFPGGPRPENGVEWLYRAATGGCYEAMKDLGVMLMDIPSYFPRLPQQPPLARRDYAQAARFLRMALQYRDQEAAYLLSLMYSQGWGMPVSTELSRLMMERLNGSGYLTSSLNLQSAIAACWLPLPVEAGSSTTLRFTVPGPFAPAALQGVTLHNTCKEQSFSFSKLNVLQNGRVVLDIFAPQKVAPGQSSKPIGISIPEGFLADTTLPLEVEILLVPGSSCGVVELPLPVEKERP